MTTFEYKKPLYGGIVNIYYNTSTKALFFDWNEVSETTIMYRAERTDFFQFLHCGVIVSNRNDFWLQVSYNNMIYSINENNTGLNYYIYPLTQGKISFIKDDEFLFNYTLLYIKPKPIIQAQDLIYLQTEYYSPEIMPNGILKCPTLNIVKD